MGILEIIAIGIGLAMDSFAVSICKGLAMKKMNWKNALIIAGFFGVFHMGMLIIGYFLGTAFSSFVESVDHWIAFVLLLVIGGKMIVGSFERKPKKEEKGVDVKSMLMLAIATSIDALAVGVTFAFFETNILMASLTIGLIIFLVAVCGVWIGNKFGGKLQNKAEFLGGVILVIIGLKILLEHLGVIGF